MANSTPPESPDPAQPPTEPPAVSPIQPDQSGASDDGKKILSIFRPKPKTEAAQ